MKKILKLSSSLYVDLDTGDCRRTEETHGGKTSRLTRRQLEILNFLVLNRERLCTREELEGLADSAHGAVYRDMETSIVKNHISRLKKVLKSVDTGFGEQANRVFEAVHGSGYIFHMPKDGKLIETRAPVDGIDSIDWEFIRGQKLESEVGIENLKNIFYGITGDRKVIMQAVCNNIHVSNAKYKKLLREFSAFVFAPKAPAAPVFLMADGGTGKSTLLCQFALQTAIDHPGWNVSYLDLPMLGDRRETYQQVIAYLYQNGISRTRKNVLCIDSPHENPDGFRELYQCLLGEGNPYLYVVAAERASLMLNLLESNSVYQRNSYIRGFYLDNGKGEDVPMEGLRGSHVQLRELRRYMFPQEEKEDITKQMVMHFSESRKLDRGSVAESMAKVSYGKKTVSDVFIDFKRYYNESAGRRIGAGKDNYIPKIAMDWDEWKGKCRKLDPDCSRLKISEAFPYIAACSIFGIPVTYAFLKEMTDHPYKSELLQTFPQGLGECIQCVDGCFMLRHDTVADNYFACHPEISLQECMEELVTQEYMDKGTVLLFVERVFSFVFCRNPQKAPHGINLKKLADLFRESPKYMGIIREYDRLFRLEFSFIALNYNLDFCTDRNGELQDAISESFQRVQECIQDKGKMIWYWLRYVETSLLYCMEAPESLVFFAADFGTESVYVIVLQQLLNEMYQKNQLLLDEEWDERFHQLCCSIDEKAGSTSYCRLPFAPELNICELDENLSDFDYVLEDMSSEEKDMRKLEYQISHKSNGLDLRKFFGEWIRLPRGTMMLFTIGKGKGDIDYLFLISQTLLVRRAYKVCYDVLSKLKMEEMERREDKYRLCVSLGMMYGIFPKQNPYYNPQLAIENYMAALGYYSPEMEDVNGAGAVWLSLASLYYYCGEYEKAKEACIKANSYSDLSNLCSHRAAEIYIKVCERLE